MMRLIAIITVLLAALLCRNGRAAHIRKVGLVAGVTMDDVHSRRLPSKSKDIGAKTGSKTAKKKSKTKTKRSKVPKSASKGSKTKSSSKSVKGSAKNASSKGLTSKDPSSGKSAKTMKTVTKDSKTKSGTKSGISAKSKIHKKHSKSGSKESGSMSPHVGNPAPVVVPSPPLTNAPTTPAPIPSPVTDSPITAPSTTAPVPSPTTALPSLSTSAPDSALARSLPLRQAVTEENMVVHLQALQDIAEASNNNRATSTSGYKMSVEYVVTELEAAGYNATIQNFTADVSFDLDGSLASISPINGSVIEEYTLGTEFTIMTWSPSGAATGMAQKSDNFGCGASDFASFQAGNIAIIERGNCTFQEKSDEATLAGAVAVIVMNSEPALFSGTLESTGSNMVPVFAVSLAVGLELIGQNISLSSNVFAAPNTVTQNIIADTEFGNPDQTVIIGAHLDSVPQGPGINDNGSAVAVALEIARQIAKEGFQSKNRIRFAFWGAEEVGLTGSEYYLRNLALTEGFSSLQEMKLYLNLEMLASANFVRAIYPPMSTSLDSINVETQVVQIFQEYFTAENIVAAVLPDPFVPALRTRSDHANFQSNLVNIPAGGVITGADIPKPPEFVALFGGEVGVWAAPCYHMPCDNLDNARTDVMHELADGYAHALWTFANMDEIGPTRRRDLEGFNRNLALLDLRRDVNSRFYQGEMC